MCNYLLMLMVASTKYIVHWPTSCSEETHHFTKKILALYCVLYLYLKMVVKISYLYWAILRANCTVCITYAKIHRWWLFIPLFFSDWAMVSTIRQICIFTRVFRIFPSCRTGLTIAGNEHQMWNYSFLPLLCHTSFIIGFQETRENMEITF